jgi:hypothetical protein
MFFATVGLPDRAPTVGIGQLWIGHPSGVVLVDAATETDPEGALARRATVYRLAISGLSGSGIRMVAKKDRLDRL